MADEIKVEESQYAGYSKKTVEEIVRRMKKIYMARGMSEEEASALALKKAVSGTRALEIEAKGPAELVASNNKFYRLVGRVFKAKLLNKLVDKIANMDLSVTLMRDLDAANIPLSTKQFIAVSLFASFLASLFLALLAFLVSLPDLTTSILSFFLVFIAAFPASFFVAMKWPGSTAKKRGREIDKVLPFALRHMATELKAGVSIHDAMRDIVKSDYGILSQEFDRTLQDIDKGMTTEDAIQSLAERSPSDGLARAALHMVRALRIGGNLADILSEVAEDAAFDLRMKMRDFVERLSLVSLFYMMIGIVMPVFFTVLAAIFNAIPTLGFQGILGPTVLMLVYIVLIPMTLGLMLYIVKVMQPM